MHLPDRPMVGAHLDLKGALWKPAYLPAYLADLKAVGVNTLLVEYEDIFPYHGLDIAAHPRDVWSAGTLRRFLATARELDIEIVPLQQCLGHLEYLFRWQRYRHLAEGQAYPATIKIGDRDAVALLKDMLGQIMTAHPDSRYIHLGMDEAHDLKKSSLVQTHGGVLGAFLAHLDELASFVESHGKTPIIWTDMIEDHYDPKSPLMDLKDRVVLTPWDYSSTGAPRPDGRIHGWRVSREWWRHPERDGGPAMASQPAVVEDLPAAIRREVAPYFDTETNRWQPLWQVDWLSQKGFKLWGAAAVRCCSMGETITNYRHTRANLTAWTDAIQRNDQLGVLATSWARGTTFCPPNVMADLTWPGLQQLGRLWGSRGPAFWSGIPAAKLDRVLTLVSRCQQGWEAQAAVLDEMAALRPKLKTHHWEWDALALCLETSGWHKRAHFAGLEVEWFRAARLPVAPEWDRRLIDQRALTAEGRALRQRLHAHFRQRYRGPAYTEWLDHLITVPIGRLAELTTTSRRARTDAIARYR